MPRADRGAARDTNAGSFASRTLKPVKKIPQPAPAKGAKKLPPSKAAADLKAARKLLDEAKKFLLAVAGGPAENSNVHDALSAAATVTAAEESAASGQWQKLEPVAGTTASRIMVG